MKLITTILIAITALAFVGCAKKDGAASSSSSATANVPTFSSSVVNDYVKAYDAFCNDYIKAYKSKDAGKFQSLAAKQADLAAKGQEAAKALKADEVQKFSDWTNKKAQELSAAMTGS